MDSREDRKAGIPLTSLGIPLIFLQDSRDSFDFLEGSSDSLYAFIGFLSGSFDFLGDSFDVLLHSSDSL